MLTIVILSATGAALGGWYLRGLLHKNESVIGLCDLHRELGQIRWLGKDEGWDGAIDAVRARIHQMVIGSRPAAEDR